VLDLGQVVAILVLASIGILSSLVFYREFASYVPARRKTEVDRPNFLKVAITVLFFIPIALACSIGAVWLITLGWEGFEWTILMSLGVGLVMGILISALLYFTVLIGNRQEQRIERDMKKIEKTKRPLPARYAAKAAFAIVMLVLGTIGFDLLASGFTIQKSSLQAALIFEATLFGIMGLSPLVPTGHSIPVSPRDPSVKWWMISLLAVASILVFSSVLLTYVF
jgi:uncharacterized membrane protein YciS (DUF1049 family)